VKRADSFEGQLQLLKFEGTLQLECKFKEVSVVSPIYYLKIHSQKNSSFFFFFSK
jgi:hypothetical protein